MFRLLLVLALLFSTFSIATASGKEPENLLPKQYELAALVQEPIRIELPEIEPLDIKVEPIIIETAEDNRQIKCLADNVYFEARGEPLRGRYAVANVTMNRVESERFPDTVCGVVHQKWKRTCQFSWACKPYRVTDMVAYQNALDIAREAYHNEIKDITGGAQYFHAAYSNPRWSRQFERTLKVGLHYFYRE